MFDAENISFFTLHLLFLSYFVVMSLGSQGTVAFVDGEEGGLFIGGDHLFGYIVFLLRTFSFTRRFPMQAAAR